MWSSMPAYCLLPLLMIMPAISYGQANTSATKVEQSTQSIKVKTELIQVRAVVTDRTGRAVDGLTRDDFQLFEDRMEQPVSFFSLERIEGDPGVKPGPVREAKLESPTTHPDLNAHSPRSRALVLLVDTVHLAHDSLESVRTALRRFVEEQVTDRDLVTLMTTAGKPGTKGELTADRKKLLEQIRKIHLWQVPSESLLTASLCGKVVRRDPDAEKVATQIFLSEERTTGSLLTGGDQGEHSKTEMFGKCRQVLMEASHRRRLVLSAIEEATEKLANFSGQRIVALFSDGFSVIATGGEIAAADIRPPVSRAVRSGVVIYTLDAKGMTPVMLAASQVYPSLVKNDDGMSEMHESVRDTQLGVAVLATETGGQAFFNTNDFNRPMQKMLDDNRTYYELSYYPPPDKDPAKYREISVSVKNHPEYRVRAQKGYVLADLRRGR